jgi:hypothetical protein
MGNLKVTADFDEIGREIAKNVEEAIRSRLGFLARFVGTRWIAVRIARRIVKAIRSSLR